MAGAILILHPDTPLSPEWNPAAPLDVDEPLTPLTQWKLRRAAANPALCMAALPEDGHRAMPPLIESDVCGIDPRLTVTQVGDARIAPVETTCAIALRMAMWERHSLQPEASRRLGSSVAEIRHLSSYNCRQMRLPGGQSGGMSTHATAEAIDITGFRLIDGRTLDLTADWGGAGPEAEFLKAAHRGACRWFRTALGPDYNALHRDHFHLQSRGWGLCR